MILPMLLAMASPVPPVAALPTATADYRMCLIGELGKIIAVTPFQPGLRDMLIERARRSCAAERAEAAERIEAAVEKDPGGVAEEQLERVEISVANALLGPEEVESNPAELSR